MHRFVGAGHAHRIALVLLQKAEQVFKMRVVGGPRNAAMKGQIFLDPVVTLRDGLVQAIERLLDVSGFLGIHSFGGQSADFAFEHPPHFDHLQHGVHGSEHRRVEGEGAGAVERRDEDP